MKKFTVEKEIQFDMGHRVPNHKSKCRNPHGHRYRVVACVEGPLVTEEGVSDQGMVMDFSDIKDTLTTRIHDVYDHGFMIYEGDKELEWFLFPGVAGLDEKARNDWNVHKVPFIPTAENLAWHFYEIMAGALDDETSDVKVRWVKVWETPTSVATYPGGSDV